MTTDFLDDDLLAPEGNEDESSEELAADDIPQISDLNLTRMVRQKQELSSKMASAVEEMERLRRRQSELERERETIESLTGRQTDYEEGRRRSVAKLERGVVLLGKEEANAARMVELLASTREKFEESLEELRDIRDDTWSDEEFESELNAALATIENAEKSYDNAEAKISAVAWSGEDRAEASPLERAAARMADRPGFWYWLKVGVAVSLPLILVVVLLYAVHFYLMGLI